MDDDQTNIIRRALDVAEDAGRDYVGQTELAVRTLRQARLDMTASEAQTAVELVRDSQWAAAGQGLRQSPALRPGNTAVPPRRISGQRLRRFGA